MTHGGSAVENPATTGSATDDPAAANGPAPTAPTAADPSAGDQPPHPRAFEGSTPATDDPAGRVRRIGIMGGTFDPIHNGHLVAGSEVAHLFGLDEVVFVPTGQPWQKENESVSAAEDRYLMTVIATASNPQFSVSRADIARPGPTYTVDTLRDMRAIYGPHVQMYFITGADALSAMLSWKDADQMFSEAHFVGVTRPGYQLSGAHLPSHAASLVEIPALAISSTSCRERVAAGQPVWYLVPDGVVRYIDKRGLYRTDGPADGAGYR